MAALKTVWGIDIGQCALKALKLREVDGQLQAEAFDIIEHPKILSQPDADRTQLIRNSLEQFLARNDLSNSLVAVAVPGQSSFTRFVKLPPVETKRIADIVRFEAEQQIPFDINEVIWRWQSFPDPDSPDIEVGLFAIKRNDVYNTLAPFNDLLVGIDVVQMAPLALYNFMTYDQQVATDGATLLVDIGADNTNLVIADGPRLWTRTIQLGGNNFTESLVKSFKLSFSKAEKLKRTAATSKYARQIFQAMRPVFADLVQEIQRSIGYYTSLHRETRFKKVLGLGNGFRLPGLQKFLEQNLNLSVVRIDGYNALQPSPTVSAPQFTENVLSFAVSYGLALQGLELTRIDTNLLPEEISSQRRWAKKRPWFAAAAGIVLAALAGMTVRNIIDKGALDKQSSELQAAESMKAEYERLQRQYRTLQGQGDTEQTQAQELLRTTGYRSWWPNMLAVLSQSIRQTFPDQMALEGSGAELASIMKGQPARFIVVTQIQSTYEQDVNRAVTAGAGAPAPEASEGILMPPPMFGGPAMPTGGTVVGAADRGFTIVLEGYCPMETADLLNNMLRNSEALAQPYAGEFAIVNTKIDTFGRADTTTPGGAARPPGMLVPPGMGGAAIPPGMSAEGRTVEPVKDITGRTTEDYNPFRLVWHVKIVGDGLTASTATP